MDEDALLKDFYADVSELERDNEVERVLSSFKLNPFEHLNLPFDSSPEDVKKQYRKISLMIHPDKCHHPRAKEAFGAIAKAQTMLLDAEERGYVLQQINQARDAIVKAKKKEIKRDHTAKLLSLVNKDALTEYLNSDEFKAEWKKKAREILTEQEWRRRKMSLRISEEEGRLHKEEEETRDMYKRKREENEKWEDTRENRVTSWRDFQKGGKKPKSGGPIKPPKLKTEDPTKSYIQRPVIKR